MTIFSKTWSSSFKICLKSFNTVHCVNITEADNKSPHTSRISIEIMSLSCLVMALHILCIYRLHFGLMMHGAINTEFQCCLKQSNRTWMSATVKFVFFLKECHIWLTFMSFFLGKAQHKSLGQTETGMRAVAFDNAKDSEHMGLCDHIMVML